MCIEKRGVNNVLDLAFPRPVSCIRTPSWKAIASLLSHSTSKEFSTFRTGVFSSGILQQASQRAYDPAPRWRLTYSQVPPSVSPSSLAPVLVPLPPSFDSRIHGPTRAPRTAWRASGCWYTVHRPRTAREPSPEPPNVRLQQWHCPSPRSGRTRRFYRKYQLRQHPNTPAATTATADAEYPWHRLVADCVGAHCC